MGKGTRFKPQFKREVAELVDSGQRSATVMAREIGVHVNTVYKWVQQYRDDPEQAFPGSGHRKPAEEELFQAKRRIRELEEDIEILKKFTAYAAKNGL